MQRLTLLSEMLPPMPSPQYLHPHKPLHRPVPLNYLTIRGRISGNPVADTGGLARPTAEELQVVELLVVQDCCADEHVEPRASRACCGS